MGITLSTLIIALSIVVIMPIIIALGKSFKE